MGLYDFQAILDALQNHFEEFQRIFRNFQEFLEFQRESKVQIKEIRMQ